MFKVATLAQHNTIKFIVLHYTLSSVARVAGLASVARVVQLSSVANMAEPKAHIMMSFQLWLVWQGYHLQLGW